MQWVGQPFERLVEATAIGGLLVAYVDSVPTLPAALAQVLWKDLTVEDSFSRPRLRAMISLRRLNNSSAKGLRLVHCGDHRQNISL